MAELNEMFAAGLEKIRTLAAKKKGSVSVRDILDAFPGAALSDEQIRRVYDYLAEENITLSDYVPHDTNQLSLSELSADPAEAGELDEEDRRLYELYLEDLESIRPLSAAEEKALAARLVKGSASERRAARERLTEGNLRWVVQLSAAFAGQGPTVSDLIQEGNMALMLALESFDGESELGTYLENEIRKSLKSFVKEQQGYQKAGQRMAAEANRILEATKELEEDTGRAVTPEELAKKLGMSPSRVNEVLQESARAIRLEER